MLAAEHERSVHLESDWFFRVIRRGYVEPWKPESHEQNVTVIGAVAAAAAGFADGGYFTIVDGIVSPKWFFAPLRDSLKAAGHSVAYAVLRPPLAICAERVAVRENSQLAEVDVVEQMWREFSDMGPLEAHVIDNELSSPAITAQELRRRLLEGLLEV